MYTSRLPEKALSFMGTKGWTSQEVAQSFHLCRVYSLFLAKTRMLSLFFFHYFLPLKSSSNTTHITMPEFSLEASQRQKNSSSDTDVDSERPAEPNTSILNFL